MTYDLAIRGGQVVLPDRDPAACDIAIRAGKIAALLAPGESAAAAAEFSATGLTILPGAIDVHLHLGHGNDISRPRTPQDAAQETAAAVAGYVSDYGVPTLKIFMNNRGGEEKRLGLPDIDDGFLLRLCEAAARHGAYLRRTLAP